MKKGIAAETVGLILILVFIAASFGWISRIFSSGLNEEIINKQCWESELFNAEARIAVVGTQTRPVKCPTKYITIHKDKLEQEYEEGPSTNNEPFKLPDIAFKNADKKICANSEDEEACVFRNVNKAIANELARCWSDFHKGQRRVFSLYKEDQSQCVVCSVVLFDSEMADEYSDLGVIGLSNPESEDYSLDLFMRNNNNLKYTGDENYYKYTLDLVDEYFELPYYDYDVNREYAVVFAAINKNAIKDITEDAWKLIKEKFTDYVPADEKEGNFVNTLHFIPNEEVSNICDTLE